MATPLPAGFRAHVANVGIKDETDDFVIIVADRRCSAAGVFTRSRFAGPSVVLSRASVADGALQAYVVVSKNANVATGTQGMEDAREVVRGVAQAYDLGENDVLIASTGVIGRRYPMDRVRVHLASLDPPPPLTEVEPAALGIMTTDTFAKVSSTMVDDVTIVGFAKGVGMIEPDMATLIALFMTDAAVDSPDLDAMFRRVIDRTLNAVSVDTDTSTSDTAAVMASGAAGPVDLARLEVGLHEVALALTRMIARDGEGATKVLVVTVDGGRNDAQAKRVAKAIVNSPLVKTAVHGADPNWGRVAMAVGKCSDDIDIDQDRVVIRFGEQQLYPGATEESDLVELTKYLAGDEVLIHVTLGIGAGAFTVYGCDLSDGYVRINADYTT